MISPFARFFLIGFFLVAGGVGCTKKQGSPSPFEQGKTVYMARCIACHNSDPKVDGPIGPAVKGSSKDLLEAKIMSMNYPAGYSPKRDSKLMPAMPDLKNDIEALHVFLNQ